MSDREDDEPGKTGEPQQVKEEEKEEKKSELAWYNPKRYAYIPQKLFGSNTGNSSQKSIEKTREYWDNMPIEEKRSHYKCKNYLTVDDIEKWSEYISRVDHAEGSPDLSSTNALLASKVSLWRGDITRLEIDAIVNAANSSLLGGGGVDGAIHSAAGSSLMRECETLDGCETGKAKLTSGHRLPARNIIHTVGPIYHYSNSESESAELLKNCYENSLMLAFKHSIKTIAFPCISTGIYGYPNTEAARIALRTVRTMLTSYHNEFDRIIFCVFLKEDESIYRRLLREYFPIDDQHQSQPQSDRNQGMGSSLADEEQSNPSPEAMDTGSSETPPTGQDEAMDQCGSHDSSHPAKEDITADQDQTQQDQELNADPKDQLQDECQSQGDQSQGDQSQEKDQSQGDQSQGDQSQEKDQSQGDQSQEKDQSQGDQSQGDQS